MNKKTIWILIIVGFVLRIGQYLVNRSIWLDESSLALNIIERSWAQLTQPLSYKAYGPVGFLELERLAVKIFGISEYSLRLFPLLASLLSVWLFYQLVKQILDKNGVTMALIFFIISSPLIYYASEVKSYSFDVLFSILIPLMFLKYKKSLLNFILLVLVGSIAVWISEPAIFILAGTGLTYFVYFLTKKKTSELKGLFIMGFFWLTSFIVNYFLFLNKVAGDPGMVAFWSFGFAPFPILSISDVYWYINNILTVFSEIIGLSLPLIGVFFFLIGGYFMYKKSRKNLPLFILPLLLCLFASMLHKYPFSGRFLLFLVPGIIIVTSYGFEQLLKSKNLIVNSVTIILGVLLFISPVLTSVKSFINPFMKEEIRPVIKYYLNNRKKDDILYLYYASELPFKYYIYNLNIKNIKYKVGTGRTTDTNQYINDLDGMKNNPRVWFLFSHVANINSVNEEYFFVNYLNRIGRKSDSSFAEGASIYLYDLFGNE